MRKFLFGVIWVLLVVLTMMQGAAQVPLPPMVSIGLLGLIVSIVAWNYLNLDAPPQYREYLYQPLDSYNLPQGIRDVLDEETPNFRRLGFEKVEDARLSEKPFPHDFRIFLNARGDVWGEINFVNNGFISLDCTSIFDDGMKIETSSLSLSISRLPEPRDRMQWFLVPGGSADEVHRSHLEALERYHSETGAELLIFSPADYQDVTTYGHRLLWHWRRRRGLTDQQLPEAALPQRQRTAMLSSVNQR